MCAEITKQQDPDFPYFYHTSSQNRLYEGERPSFDQSEQLKRNPREQRPRRSKLISNFVCVAGQPCPLQGLDLQERGYTIDGRGNNCGRLPSFFCRHRRRLWEYHSALVDSSRQLFFRFLLCVLPLPDIARATEKID